MSLERDGPGETLEDEVLELLVAAGWVNEVDEYVLRLPRTTYRGSLTDFLGYALRLGVPALRAKLEVDSANARRDSHRNAFRERAVAAALPKAVSEMLERGVGAKLVRLNEDGRPPRPRVG